MPVGLLAKLVAFVMFALAAVGIFVGGQFLASCFDKLAGPKPPTVERTAATPPATRPPAVRPTPPGNAALAGVDPAGHPDRAPGPASDRGAASRAPSHPRRPAAPARHPEADTRRHGRSRERRPRSRLPPRSSHPPGTPRRPSPRAPRPQTPPSHPIAPPAAVVPLERPPHPKGLGLEPVLVDLQLGRLVSRTVAAFRDDDEALVPLAAFFEMAEIGYTVGPQGALEGKLEPSGELIRVTPGSDSVSVGKRRFPILPEPAGAPRQRAVHRH